MIEIGQIQGNMLGAFVLFGEGSVITTVFKNKPHGYGGLLIMDNLNGKNKPGEYIKELAGVPVCEVSDNEVVLLFKDAAAVDQMIDTLKNVREKITGPPILKQGARG